MESRERAIPFDPVIKIALLFFHFAGFSVWLGMLYADQTGIVTYAVITIGTGFLLVLREIIKDGFVWLVTTEGICTIAKVIILAAAFAIEAKNPVILLVLILLGILSAHLPKPIKDKKFFLKTWG